MSTSVKGSGRVQRLVCYECAVELTTDDHHHYGYQCHSCVLREHELLLVWQIDPAHPETERLGRSPVEIGYSR